MSNKDKFNYHNSNMYTLYIHMYAPRLAISVRCNLLLVLNTTDCINYDMCAMQSVEADGCTVDEKIVTSRCGKCCSPTMRG